MSLASFFVRIGASGTHGGGGLGLVGTQKGNESYFNQLLPRQLFDRPLHFQASSFIADKLEPFNLGVLQRKRRDPRKFGLNEILLSAPAVQICALTVHVEVSIVGCAVAAYVFTNKKTAFKEQASSAATHVDILSDRYPRLIPIERHDELSRMTSAFTGLFRMEWNPNE
jgi:hypothetical protein